MEIKTESPVIVDNNKISTINSIVNSPIKDFENSYDAGNLKVTTANPVIYENADIALEEFYSNAPGDKEPSIKEKLDRKAKRKEFWNNAKGKWEKISKSPAAQFALQQLAQYQAQKQGIVDGSQNQTKEQITQPTTQPESQPMSKGMKITLVVAGVLVVGLIIYSVLSKSPKSKVKTALKVKK